MHPLHEIYFSRSRIFMCSNKITFKKNKRTHIISKRTKVCVLYKLPAASNKDFTFSCISSSQEKIRIQFIKYRLLRSCGVTRIGTVDYGLKTGKVPRDGGENQDQAETLIRGTQSCSYQAPYQNMKECFQNCMKIKIFLRDQLIILTKYKSPVCGVVSASFSLLQFNTSK